MRSVLSQRLFIRRGKTIKGPCHVEEASLTGPEGWDWTKTLKGGVERVS